jgi:hypothetical protein
MLLLLIRREMIELSISLLLMEIQRKLVLPREQCKTSSKKSEGSKKVKESILMYSALFCKYTMNAFSICSIQQALSIMQNKKESIISSKV